MLRIHTYIHIYIYTYTYIYTEKDAVRSPSVHVSGNAVFLLHHVTCSILYVHIPVMVLLEIHTDCQTSSEVAKECPESHEDPQGKGRRKNKHSVCVYIYIASLRGRGDQGTALLCT